MKFNYPEGSTPLEQEELADLKQKHLHIFELEINT